MHSSPHIENRAPRTARNTIHVALAALLLATGWAHFTELPEMAFAKGSIQPAGSLRRVEHLDGGVISTIFVAEGDSVAEDGEIVRLSDADVEAAIKSLRVRERILTQALERNRLVLSAIGFSGSNIASSVLSNQRASAQTESYEASRRRLDEGVSATRARIVALKANIANLTERARIEDRELERVRALHGKGLSRDDVLYESEIRANTTRADLLAMQERLTLAERDEIDAQAALDEFFARFRETLLSDIEATLEELSLVQQAMVENRLQRDRITVTAPVSGVIQDIYVSSRGEVVEPGGLIAELLPTTETLIAELQIRPRDIGHISLGDPVDVNLTTFNTRKYGALEGWVSQISPTSTKNERQEPYYLVRVDLEQQRVASGTEVRPLKAGMEVDAAIRTGNRSVLNYILSPIIEPFGRAFRER